MAWRQGCMGSMNMQCELNLYSTFLKKVLFQQLRINPTPTLDVCCNHFDNPLIAIVLHTSAVGAGFIPALPTADKIQSKSPAAARVEINGSYMSNNSLIL